MSDSATQLGPVPQRLRNPADRFRLGKGNCGPVTLGDYWQWSGSSLLDNTERGIVAEFLVALALGLTESPRLEWASFDLETAAGTKIEVKSAAYLQSWHQERYSTISFRIAPTTWEWDPESQKSHRHDPPKHLADAYVFCLLKHKCKATVNPLDTEQWQFYVMPTSRINDRKPDTKSIGVRALSKLAGGAVAFSEIADAVAIIEKDLRKSGCHSP
ncbi:MAG: hypothetical protein OXI38_02770 [Bacteroidota bacterium]|nr:hypothetical protein [Bacteroidota bacterium]